MEGKIRKADQVSGYERTKVPTAKVQTLAEK